MKKVVVCLLTVCYEDRISCKSCKPNNLNINENYFWFVNILQNISIKTFYMKRTSIRAVLYLFHIKSHMLISIKIHLLTHVLKMHLIMIDS